MRIKDTNEQPEVASAWVIVGVPAYATPIINIVTGYDLVYQIATELPATVRLIPPSEVSFTRDIYPVLKRTVLMQWVSSLARTRHSSGLGGDFLDPALFDLLRNNNPRPGSAERQAREHVFSKLRDPAGGGGNMSLISGRLTVTPLMYEKFRRWYVGDFIDDWNSEQQVVPFEQLPVEQQPDALDRAALESMVGGSFSPGIEVGEIISDTDIYEQPFRFKSNLLPGMLTQSLSIPWQADFNLCGSGWWPGGRPNSVTSDGINFYNWVPRRWSMNDMLHEWDKLGFIKRKEADSDIYIEDERLI